MKVRDYFKPNEWRLVVFSPIFAANGMAEIDGKISNVESMTVTEAMLSARETYKTNQLIMAVVDDYPKMLQEAELPTELLQIRNAEQALEAFSRVAQVIDKKVHPDEGREYKQFILAMAEKVANAGRGAFDFFGGNVSKTEAGFLDQLKGALNL